MIQQRVEGHSWKGWRGIALVAVIAAAVVLGSMFFSWLGRYIGGISAPLFIVYGILIAWFLLDCVVMAFTYTSNGSSLRVCRAYGRRERLMTEIWLNGLQACGSLADMQKRFHGAKVQRAVKRGCSIEPVAVAYNAAGRTELLVIQPNDALRKAIRAALKK